MWLVLGQSQGRPRGSDESILYNTLFNACNWHGVNRAEEIRQTGVCVWYFRQFYNALLRGDRDSEELILYSALWRACFQVGVDRAEEIRQTGACLSDFRRGWKAPRTRTKKADTSDYSTLVFWAASIGPRQSAKVGRVSRTTANGGIAPMATTKECDKATYSKLVFAKIVSKMGALRQAWPALGRALVRDAPEPPGASRVPPEQAEAPPSPPSGRPPSRRRFLQNQKLVLG